ncbi:hypothetical protein OESDEN_10643 [Oesophagostomum dentatum]|uniref:Acyltransferase 3 domain-containing protein n=1 Tax=Oesophagostomum dentatum TaxID=61180 RepID=A0A0B1SX39_OESDE|nr:hypothetical protein OESDEN_10643 [Oesophagostomum dentatum]
MLVSIKLRAFFQSADTSDTDARKLQKTCNNVHCREFVRGTYNNFSRVGWALAVSWVIVANHLGWGGLIAKFMDHPSWQPLGRLSYCGYIVHFYLLRYIFNLDDQASHFVSIWQSYICKAIPLIVASYVFAFFWSCLFEVPAMKLEKILIAGLLPKRNDGVQPKDVMATNKRSNDSGSKTAIEEKSKEK